MIPRAKSQPCLPIQTHLLMILNDIGCMHRTVMRCDAVVLTTNHCQHGRHPATVSALRLYPRPPLFTGDPQSVPSSRPPPPPPTCRQLHHNAAYAPQVTRVAPAQPQDDFGCAIVACRHDRRVVLVLKGGAAKVNDLYAGGARHATTNPARFVGPCQRYLSIHRDGPGALPSRAGCWQTRRDNGHTYARQFATECD